MNGPDLDLDMARQFLAALDFEGRVDAPHAFQTFPDVDHPSDEQRRTQTRGGEADPKLNGSFEAALPQLLSLYKAGASVHVAINQTDGVGRRQENVTALRAVCCDWDHGQFYRHQGGYTLPQNGIGTGPEPSMVIRTSRGVHAYWLLHPYKGDEWEDYCNTWRRTQKAFAHQFDADPNVCALSSTLRMPGFLHRKCRPLDEQLHRQVLAQVDPDAADAAQQIRAAYIAQGGEFAPATLITLEKCDPEIRYEIQHVIRSFSLNIAPRPQVKPPELVHYDLETRIKRCRALLSHVPAAKESKYGGNGDAYAYTKGVCGIGGDFGLDPDEFWPLLLEWNAGCLPPWDERQLLAKLEACHRARTEPFGWRLEQESDEHRRRREAFERRIHEHEEERWAASMTAPEASQTPSDKKRGKDAQGGGPGKPGNPPTGGSAGGGGEKPPENIGPPELWKLNSVKTVCNGPDQIPQSHLGNSQRFLDHYGRHLNYVKTFGCWYVWNGMRWRQDADAEETHVRPPAPAGDTLSDYVKASTSDPFYAGNYVMELGKQTVRSMQPLTDEIRRYEKKDGKKVFDENGKMKLDAGLTFQAKKEWRQHCMRSESEGSIGQMLRLASSDRDVARFPAFFDPYNHLINTEQGVQDLRTGLVYPHHPGFSQSKVVRLRPNRSACPTWTKFLERVLQENDDMIRFVQRAVGYSLTGETREQVLFLLYGTGRNGKSTFLNVLHGLAGEYAQHAEFSTFIERQSDVVRNDLARLHKSRLVTAVEPRSTGYLDESVIKQVTGQDVVTARFLFQEHFEYIPRFKIWLAANHKPMIRGNDEGIWRRILMVPFTVTIPEEEKDPNLPHKLIAELPAIFAWAADGAKLWYENGLNPPDVVREATQAYRDDMDSIGMFLSIKCVMQPHVCAMATPLYQRYVKWTEAVGEKPMSQKKFGMRLEERGLVKRRTSKGYEYTGIAILEEERDEDRSARAYKDS